MRKRIFIWVLICLNGVEYAHAQWTKKDSVWLQNVLSGKEKLQLNPEAMEAIKSGSLIILEKPDLEMQMIPVTPLPIIKDFSEYIQPDSSRRKVALKDLPPSVFWRYNLTSSQIPSVYQSMLDEVKRAPLFVPKGLVTFDIAKMTSRKEYVHKRNAKRDGTWKNYNNLPTPDIIKKKKEFEKNNPEVAFALKDTLQKIMKDSLMLADTIRKADSLKVIMPLKEP